MSVSGSIDAYGRPRVQIWLRGPYGTETYEAVVDTGFSGALSTPSHVAERLGLRRRNTRPVMGPDGRVRIVGVFIAEVRWPDDWLHCEVLESGVPEVLSGAGLLRNRKLTIDYGTALTVEIDLSE